MADWLSEVLEKLNVFEELWNLLIWMKDKVVEGVSWTKDKIVEGISCVFQNVRSFMWNIYNCLRGKLSSIFEHASVWAQDMFITITGKVNKEIVTLDSEAGKVLQDSLKNNCQSQMTTVVGVDIGDTEYAKKIFGNAKIDSALQKDITNKDNGYVHPITSDLLDISIGLARKLGKTSLKDHQDMFEVLSSVVKEEYKHKIETYGKMLDAAISAAGHSIDIEAFNCSLGIKGDVIEHYWQEAMISVLELRLSYWIKEKIENLQKPKKLLILPLSKQEVGVPGVYRLIGVHGENKFTADKLIDALKQTKFDLSEGEPVIKETSKGMMIRTEDLTFAAVQELNSENTSVGVLFVVKNEDLKKEDSILLTM